MACEDDSQKVIAAKEALALSDKCPEAYVLLTYDKSASEGKPVLEKALSLAEDLVGKETIHKPGVDLLEVEDGPAYLLARKTLGFCMAALGDEAGALYHLKAVATLDPQDGIGVGHTLIISFLTRADEEDDDHAWQIASAQRCMCPYHLYSRALLSYRRQRSQAQSESLLRQALVANPYVALFLLGVFELPENPPTAQEVAEDGYLAGKRAAGAYASAAFRAWAWTPGALEWMGAGMYSISEEVSEELGATLEELVRLADTEILDYPSDPSGEKRESFAGAEVGRGEEPAWAFVCRQPERESEAISRYKEALEIVLEESAVEHQLRAERSRPLAGLTFFTVIGTTGEILEMVEGLIDEGVGGFVVCTWLEKDEAVFEALGVEVVMKEAGPPVNLSEFFTG